MVNQLAHVRYDQPLHDVAQLTNVAGPGCGSQRLQRFRGNGFDRPIVFFTEVTHKVIDQQRDILAALSERRQHDGYDVQSIVEIFTKRSISDELFY